MPLAIAFAASRFFRSQKGLEPLGVCSLISPQRAAMSLTLSSAIERVEA